MHSRYGFIPSRFPKDLCRAMCICVKLCMVWLCQTWFGKHFGSEFSEFSSLWGCCWGSVESRVGSSFQVTCICFKWELNKTIFPIPKKMFLYFLMFHPWHKKWDFLKNPQPTLPFWCLLEGYHGFWVDVPLDLYWHHWAGTSRKAETISKPSSLDNSTGSRRDSE